MFKPADTVRAHRMARGIAPACNTYREAYAIGCAHVAASKRSAAAPLACPTRTTKAAAVCYAASALVTLTAWATCPAVAAAAN